MKWMNGYMFIKLHAFPKLWSGLFHQISIWKNVYRILNLMHQINFWTWCTSIVYRIDVLKDVWWSGIGPYLDAHVSQINFWTWYRIDAQRCIKHWYRSFIQQKRKLNLNQAAHISLTLVKWFLNLVKYLVKQWR